jgi:type VI secretion system secreted protein VgrG
MAEKSTMVLTSKAGKDLQFKSMSASEGLGTLFEFDIQALSSNHSLSTGDLLGTPASVAVGLRNGAKRHFHGIICAMGMEGSSQRAFQYRLVLRPWLWLLTRRSDTRVFQAMNLEAILKKVFEPFSPNVKFELSGDPLPVYEYCVQYRESDFNFVSRMMEQEGVYYYFEHDADKHTMVIVNTPSAHQPSPYQDVFEYREVPDRSLKTEPITEWKVLQEIQSGKVVLRDFDFVKPKLSLEAATQSMRSNASSKLEVYDYPGIYAAKDAGQRYSKLRLEELEARYARVSAAGPVRGVGCGYQIKLKGHPRPDQNKLHLVVSTEIECTLSDYESGSEETAFICRFIAMESSGVYRPTRAAIKPSVSGLHTAIVVGPSGDEIHTDSHGRVKVQFHWDRLGKSDEKSSCWVRVSSPWAGQNWGAISLPRIGQEVVVDFLQGDPDRPMITGRVYNGDQPPPYALPANATVSTNKSRSSKSGTKDNFNELRFEDKKGSEYVWFQAEKDFHQLVKNDATLLVTGNQERIVEKDLTEDIKGEVKLKVGKDWVSEVTGLHSMKVSKDHVTESGASVSMKSATKTDIKIGTDLGVDAGVNVHIKAGANVVIEAGVMLTLKAGGSTVVLGPAGVMIIGSMVLINSGGGGGSGGGASPKPANAVSPPKKKDDPLAS